MRAEGSENKVKEISSTLPIDVRCFLPQDAATDGILVRESAVPEDHLGVEMYETPPNSKILAQDGRRTQKARKETIGRQGTSIEER